MVRNTPCYRMMAGSGERLAICDNHGRKVLARKLNSFAIHDKYSCSASCAKESPKSLHTFSGSPFLQSGESLYFCVYREVSKSLLPPDKNLQECLCGSLNEKIMDAVLYLLVRHGYHLRRVQQYDLSHRRGRTGRGRRLAAHPTTAHLALRGRKKVSEGFCGVGREQRFSSILSSGIELAGRKSLPT